MTMHEPSELMLSARSMMNSKLIAALVFVVVGGFFCTELLKQDLLTRTAAIIVLHLGLFLSLASSSLCFRLAAEKETWVSCAFFDVWVGLVIITFFKFGWKNGIAALILFPVYFYVGRWLAEFVVGLFLVFLGREHTGILETWPCGGQRKPVPLEAHEPVRSDSPVTTRPVETSQSEAVPAAPMPPSLAWGWVCVLVGLTFGIFLVV
jgi:hypothetical protein